MGMSETEDIKIDLQNKLHSSQSRYTVVDVLVTYFVASARDCLVDTSLLLLLYATLSEIAKKVLLT